LPATARTIGGLTLIVLAIAPRSASAEHAGHFLAGAAIGFGLHEAGHVVADLAFGATPGIRKVSFGPLPFFAITHEPVSPAREFTISSAGFWSQHLTSEIILTRHPALRREDAPMLKGVLAFNVLASTAYAVAAMARIGPPERDTLGMAVSSRVGEPVIGVFVLAPAALDALRYYLPEHEWLRWASRAAKISGALLIVRAAR
jgi:hypothetical protein